MSEAREIVYLRKYRLWPNVPNAKYEECATPAEAGRRLEELLVAHDWKHYTVNVSVVDIASPK